MLKKIFCILVVLILLISSFVVPASAETVKNDWQRDYGFGKLEILEDSAQCFLSSERSPGGQTLTLYKFKNQLFDINNFKLNFDLQFSKYNSSYYAIVFSDNLKFSSSKGLFLLLHCKEPGVLRLEGQILNRGVVLYPSYYEYSIPTNEPLVLCGSNNGDGTYSIYFEGYEDQVCIYNLSNNDFTSFNDGKCYFSFGGSLGSNDGARSIEVQNLNGFEFGSFNKEEKNNNNTVAILLIIMFVIICIGIFIRGE